VSVAFGAPIGGALFMYELSRENPAWDFRLLWKTFVTCVTAVFALGLFDNTLHSKAIDWSESSLKFATSQPDVTTPTSVVAGALVIGLISGLLGAFFINVNFRINGLRGVYNTGNKGKLFEAFLIAFLCTSCFYWVPNNWASCISNHDSRFKESLEVKTDSIFDKAEDYAVSKGWCQEGYHNPLATMMWKTEGGLIKHMMDIDPLMSKV
jgi:H+/Cl- antiporter ClcA